jgi:hypothetical protein
MSDSYRVFKRNPWKRNKAWPGGWEPHGGARKQTVRRGVDLETARRICAEGNKENNARRAAGKSNEGRIWFEFEREA